MRTVQSIDLKVKRERTSHFGSAMQRISADPECRALANGIIRKAASQGGQRHIPMNEEEKKAAEDYTRALTLGSTPGSGYVNAQLIPEIYSLIAEYGIWNRFDVVPVSTNSAKLIVDTTDPLMGWIGEGVAPAETSYAGGNVTATIKKMLGWIAVNNELLADSEVDISRYLLPNFANATALRLDHSATAADGTNDGIDGQYTGMFYGGTAAVAASGNVSVATLDLEDFLKAMLVVNSAVLSRPAVWVIHPQQLVRCLSVKDLNGRPIFLPSTEAPALGAIGSILGYPVILSHAAPSDDGVSKKIAVFGDPMGMAVCLRSDFEFAAADQVRFTEDQTVFRARARGAAVVKQATAFGMLTTAAS
jgi:HK97 family phage major capsid protein